MNARETLTHLQAAMAEKGVTDIKFLYAEGSANELAENLEGFLHDAASCLSGFLEGKYSQVVFKGYTYETL